MTHPEDTAENSPPGTLSKGKSCGRFRIISRCGAERSPRAGDVVFYGTLDGWFKAVDAHSGALLWQFKTGSGIIGQPTTYKGPDGKQYVAILSGVGGWAGAIVAGGLDARDESAALGFAAAMKDLPHYTNKGGMLYVFALP